MLGYRTFFSAPSTNLIDLVRAQMYSWLRTKKRYDADRLEENVETTLGEGVSGIVLRRNRPDGGGNLRIRISEQLDTGRWTTRLTVHQPSTRRNGWVLLDIDMPEGREWSATPGSARMILEVMDAYDGQARLGSRPRIVHADELDEFIDVMRDPDRRGPAFVAGTGYGSPLVPWVDRVADLLERPSAWRAHMC